MLSRSVKGFLYTTLKVHTTPDILYFLWLLPLVFDTLNGFGKAFNKSQFAFGEPAFREVLESLLSESILSESVCLFPEDDMVEAMVDGMEWIYT